MTSPDPSAARAGPARFVPGLLLCAALALGAMGLAELPWVKEGLRWSALLLVILLGIAWRSLLPVPAIAAPGVRLAQTAVLRWAVAGLGFRLSLGELWAIGAWPLVIVLVSTASALAFGWWVAKRLRVPDDLGLLLAVGGAICGASAIVAADSVVRAERRSAAIAVGVITLLGTIGILLYPLAPAALGLGEEVYGVWDGASLHEMAQVVAAGFAVSDEAGRVATVVKLARICLLAPLVFGLAWSLRHRQRAAGEPKVAPVPWFLVLFLAFAAVASTRWLSAAQLSAIRLADLVLLCVGMAGVGLQTSFADLRAAGLRPVLAGTLQWIFLAALSLALAIWLV